MTNQNKSHDAIAFESFRKNIIGNTGVPVETEAQSLYMKKLIDIAAADVVLSDQEQEWIIGSAAMSDKNTEYINICYIYIEGCSQKLIDELEVYQPGNCPDAKNIFQNVDLPYLKNSGLSIIYNSLLAAGADGELHPQELEAINNLAKNLGFTDEQVQQVHELVNEMIELRQIRTKLLSL